MITPMGVLAGLTAEELRQLLQLGTTLRYDAGDVVFREHSGGREWYIVLEGLVRIDVDAAGLGVLAPGSTDPRPILTLGPGGGFGELALLDAGPRSAAVVVLQDATRLLMITPQTFDALLDGAIATTVLRTIVRDLAAKLRHSRLLLLQQLAVNHHVRALCEELEADCARVDPLVPLQKTLVIRDHHAFLLGDLGTRSDAVLSREILDVLVFAEPADLHALLTRSVPNGDAIFHGLFSLLRHGRLPAHDVHERLSYRFAPGRGRRAGSLLVSSEQGVLLRIDWEVKGWQCDPATGTARASLCLFIAADAGAAPDAHVAALLTGSSMPTQRDIVARLHREGVSGTGYRVLAVHHRTHEVAQTLLALRGLGFEVDAFVGIPYGEASWATSQMLDQASGHRYLCLQAIPHPTGPTHFRFDWVHSSSLSEDHEREIEGLFADPANSSSYRAAMGGLLTYLLEHAIRACRERGERLLLYEDGAYLTPLIYAIYHQPAHPLHALIRAAVDGGLLVGSVEVTTSGERAQRTVIDAHGGRPLLPVISGARDEVKLIFEAVGVAEAVLGAAATALGNLGLPTFGFRQVAVLGGNGAIGVRVVEQLAQSRRSVEQLFVVDPAARRFTRQIPVEGVEAITARLRYTHLPRHRVAAGCHLVTLRPGEAPSAALLAGQLLTALKAAAASAEVVLRTSVPLPAPLLDEIWEQLAQRGGYHVTGLTALDDGAGVRVALRCGGVVRHVSVLAPETVLAFSSLAPLIAVGLDTVIGLTGTEAFTDADLDAFLERPGRAGASDHLVLISGSSKDDEFQRVLARLEGARGGAEGRPELRGFRVHKSIHPDVGSVYQLSRGMREKRLVLLADGFAVNFFARYEKGVKTEYMDPIMTMQLVGLVRLASDSGCLPPGLHQAKDVLGPAQMRAFWQALDTSCTPLDLDGQLLPDAPLLNVRCQNETVYCLKAL